MTRQVKNKRPAREYEFDVCLSFAGEDRGYVRQVAEILRDRGARVFFDEYQQAELWGKDLYTHLDDIYRNAARYCVLFVSRHFARRVWTNHERVSAQARAIREYSEYILPARIDSTEVPGLRPTVGYIDLSKTSPKYLADLIIEKLGDEPRQNFFPPIPDKLFSRLKARSAKAKYRAEVRARDFFSTLARMSTDERSLIFISFFYGCPEELPDNTHIDLDLLRRISGFTPSKILRLLGGLQSLGFYVDVREESDHEGVGGPSTIVVLEWHDFTVDQEAGGNATFEANAVILGGMDSYCEKHALEKLQRLDFSQLASSTTSPDVHELKATPSPSAAPVANRPARRRRR